MMGKNVVVALGTQNNRNATRWLDDDKKDTAYLGDSIPGNLNMTIINEYDLYSLLLFCFLQE